MSQYVDDCPRCRAQRIAFEVKSITFVGQEYGWQNYYETFCVCGNCNRSTVFLIAMRDPKTEVALKNSGGLIGFVGSLNKLVSSKGFISTKDRDTQPAPEYLPDNIRAAFEEGAKCMAVGCFNAAGTMFRLSVDMTTKDKLPGGEVDGLNYKTRRDLGLRLPWLFDNGYLPDDLRDLSHCVKEDGNDGAHQGTLSKEDALDLLDFTEALLKRIYTEPERLRLAKERREQRRAG